MDIKDIIDKFLEGLGFKVIKDHEILPNFSMLEVDNEAIMVDAKDLELIKITSYIKGGPKKP